MNRRWHKLLKEYVEALIIALILALLIRTFVIQAFKIPSGSMKETLLIGDHLLVNKFLYGVRFPFVDYVIPVSDPEHSDIIVFEYPEEPDKDFIKRIIGIPGDTIEIRNKEVYRNGEKLSEPYARHTDSRIVEGPRDNLIPFVVPADSYFVMGDNRDESYDSRWWRYVRRDQIRGKAWRIYWSWESLSDIRFGRIGQALH